LQKFKIQNSDYEAHTSVHVNAHGSEREHFGAVKVGLGRSKVVLGRVDTALPVRYFRKPDNREFTNGSTSHHDNPTKQKKSRPNMTGIFFYLDS
jgi:hypothetical protein